MSNINNPGGSGGANAALSNLAAVAVNAALSPGADASIALDDATHRWTSLWLSSLTAGRVPYVSTAGLLADDVVHQWDATNHRLGIGTKTITGTIPLTPLTVVDTVSTSPRGILSMQISADTNGARVGFSKARGTPGSEAAVVSGDTLGRLMFRGYDGTAYLEMASIEASSTGTIATNRVPTTLIFQTAANAAPSVLTTALTLGADQSATFANTITAGVPTAITQVLNVAAARSSNQGLVVFENTNAAANGIIALFSLARHGDYVSDFFHQDTSSAFGDGTAQTGIVARSASEPMTFLVAGTNAAAEKMRIASTGAVGIGTTSPTALLDLRKSAIATTSTDALALVNATLSTSIVPVQYSPRDRKTGHAWNTSGTPADNWLEWINENRPVSGTTPSSVLAWAARRSTDGATGAYVDQMTLTSAGLLNTVGGYSIAGALAASATQPTFTSGFGGATGRTITGTAFSFSIVVGSSSTDNNGVLGMPTASNGWNCLAWNQTAPGGSVVEQSASSTSSVTLTQYDTTLGSAKNFAIGDVIRCIAVAY